jgi:hypothetical protein
MTTKFLSIAMAAGLIVGSAAVLHAHESGAPGQRIQGGTTGGPGFAPGREGTTGAGDPDDRMRGDRDDRMRDRDDRTTGSGDRDDRMLGHEHDDGR